MGLCRPLSDPDELGRAQVAELAAQVQEAGMALAVVCLPEAKKGFVLLPRRWVVERTFAWATRFRRLWQRLRAVAGDAGLMLVKAAVLLKSASHALIGF